MTSVEEIREDVLPEFSLEIRGDETQPIISNFDDLRTWVGKAVDYAKGRMVSTDAKDLKPIRAQLNKLHDNLEDARKALKKRMEAPYKEWEAQYKEALASLTAAIDELGAQIKVQESRERDERLAEVERMIREEADRISTTLYPITQKIEVRSWFFEKEWENKSISRTMLTKRIHDKVALLLNGLSAAASMAKPDVARKTFLDTGDLVKAKAASDDAKALEDAQKTEPLFIHEAGTPKDEAPVQPPMEPEEPTASDGDEAVADAHRISFEVPSTYQDDEAKVIRIHRTLTGPRGAMRILLDVAASLGIELVKITPPSK